MRSLRCGDVTFSERRVIDEAPHFSLPNDYWSLFPLLRHTHMQIFYPSSQLATNKFVRDTWKGKAFSFQVFHYSYHLILTSSAHLGRIQLERRERERVLLYLSWQWDALTSTMTICDNSVSCRQYSAISICRRWRDTRTVGASDEWDISPHLIHISHFQNKQYRHLKWTPLSEGTQTTQLMWKAGGNRQFVPKKTPLALIPYTLNVCGSELTQFGSIYCSSDAILAYLYPVPMDRKPLGINKTKDNGLFQCSFSGGVLCHCCLTYQMVANQLFLNLLYPEMLILCMILYK